MGLDKWLKSDKTEENEIKNQKKNISEKKGKTPIKRESDLHPKKLKKFTLICSNSKCKYQKILMKKNLINKDKMCPKCKSIMKVK
jgi:hypothetical protein